MVMADSDWRDTPPTTPMSDLTDPMREWRDRLTRNPVFEEPPGYRRVARRPLLDDVYQHIAQVMATRSTCPRAQCGAVVVRDGQVLTTGYNGAPPKVRHCEDVGCTLVDGHCVRSSHAELNAILQASNHGVSLWGASIYCTHRPCINCLRAIAQVGIRRVVYEEEYDTDGRPDIIGEVLDVCGIYMLQRRV